MTTLEKYDDWIAFRKRDIARSIIERDEFENKGYHLFAHFKNESIKESKRRLAELELEREQLQDNSHLKIIKGAIKCQQDK